MKAARFPFVEELRFRGRNWRYRELFGSLQRHHLGTVLDVGGGHFVEATTDRPISCDLWVVVEPDRRRLPEGRDALEHAYEPIPMMEEMHRVLRPGEEIIVVVPQTANVHELPHHYQNFTRYWLEETARRLDLEVVMYQPLGGAWSTIASRLLLLRHGLSTSRSPRAPQSARYPALGARPCRCSDNGPCRPSRHVLVARRLSRGSQQPPDGPTTTTLNPWQRPLLATTMSR